MDTNQEEHTTSFRKSEMKVTPNINSFKYLDTLDDILILHLIDPSLSVLKEQLWSKATSNVDEV